MGLIQSLYKGSRLDLRTNTGGNNTLSGVVSVNGSPARRLVQLHDMNCGLLIAAMWSGVDGSYSITGLNDITNYSVSAHDHPNYTYASVAKDKPVGTWVVNLNLSNAAPSFSITQDNAIHTGLFYSGCPYPKTGRMAYNSLFGGSGYISGTVTLNGVAVKRPVFLFETKTGVLVDATSTNSSGQFSFVGVRDSLRYTVIASDRPWFSAGVAILANIAPLAIGAYADPLYSLAPLFLSGKVSWVGQTWMGTKTITGTVKVGASPVKRRVRLYENSTGILLQEKWSNPDGTYEFTNLNPACKFTVTSTDYPNYTYNDTIACNLTPV